MKRNESYTKSGPGRRHAQGEARLGTSPKYPGTHRPYREAEPLGDRTERRFPGRGY